MELSLFSLTAALAKRHLIAERAAEAPEAATDAEQEYLDLTRWTAGDQFKVYRNGKQIHPPIA